MPEDTRLLELVVRWEELRDAGQTLAIEELCQDCPDLLPVLREHLRALDALNVALAAGATLPTSPSGESVGHSDSARSEALPKLPGYEILRELGRGGMAVVYQARQTRLNRLVALKVLLSGRHATSSSPPLPRGVMVARTMRSSNASSSAEHVVWTRAAGSERKNDERNRTPRRVTSADLNSTTLLILLVPS